MGMGWGSGGGEEDGGKWLVRRETRERVVG